MANNGASVIDGLDRDSSRSGIIFLLDCMPGLAHQLRKRFQDHAAEKYNGPDLSAKLLFYMAFIINEFNRFRSRLARSIRKRIDPYPHIRYVKKRKYLFIHIPKTAGTSILDALGIYFRHHADYRVFKAAKSSLYSNVFKFCFVRNPYDRMVSTYLFLKSGGAGATDKELSEDINANSSDFESFVFNWLDQHITHTHPLFKPQYAFVCNFKYRIMVDFVGRFENIDEDWAYIAEKIGAPESLKKLNAQKNYSYKDFYSDAIAEKIYNLYQKDFEIFAYPFESYK